MIDLINRRKMLLTIPRCIATPGAVMPSATPAAMPMKIQGFASYSVCGVQERMLLVYSRAVPDAFRYNDAVCVFRKFPAGSDSPAGGLGSCG